MGRIPKQTFLQRRHTDAQEASALVIVVVVWCAQSCPTLCDPMDCSPPGSSVCGIFQARILEWVAISSSRASSVPRDWAYISCIGRQILYHWVTWKAQEMACFTACCSYLKEKWIQKKKKNCLCKHLLHALKAKGQEVQEDEMIR